MRRAQAREHLARAVGLDVAGGGELGGDALDELAGRAGGAREAAGVERHVAALDALGRERAQRGEVGREAGGAGERGEPIGVRATPASSSASRAPGWTCSAPPTVPTASGMHELAVEAAVALAPDRRAGGSAVARGVRVGAGLDRAPVLAGRDEHGVDAVHDALVVGRGAVRIELGEARGRGDRARATVGAVGAVAGELRVVDRQRTVTVRPSVRFDRMRRPARPPAIARDASASASHSVLTRFAPIASRQSTWRCTTSTPPSGPDARERRGRRARPGRRRARRAAARARRASASSCSARGAERGGAGVDVVDVGELDLADHHGRGDHGREARAGAPSARRSTPRRRPTAPRPPSGRATSTPSTRKLTATANGSA